jgi:hypothetical protein
MKIACEVLKEGTPENFLSGFLPNGLRFRGFRLPPGILTLYCEQINGMGRRRHVHEP